jgi:hypothetical protein
LRFLEESGQSLFAVVSNSIFWENDGLQIGAGGGGMGDVEVNCSDVEGGWSGDGSGNVDTDPEFCDAGAGNLRLLNISPLIDTGCDEYLPEDQGDVDDDGSRLEDLPLDLLKSPRVVDAAAALDDVDMGAYEYNDCPWDFDADNDIDLADLATMLSKFGSEHCEQDDACRADFDCDGQVGLVDLATFLARYGETCSGFTPVEGQLAASISPWNTGGYSGGGFEGESQHFVFDALIEIDEEDDDWTVSGTVITATNGAVFRLAPVDPNSDVPIPGSGEPDKYATFFSVPKSVNANGRFNNPMGDDGAIAGA